jgi:integrase
MMAAGFISERVSDLVETEAAIDDGLNASDVKCSNKLSVLKSALNYAFNEGRVSSDLAWGRVKMFTENIASHRARALSVEECKRLLGGCDPVFKPLATAALQTGMRFGELARLVVGDFNKQAGSLHVLIFHLF